MVRGLWIAFAAVLALSVAVEPFVAWHPHFELEKLPGFNALYGFLSCAALILIAKAIGLLVKRPQEHYDE